MHIQSTIAASLAALVLSACGSPEEPPVEQIVVSEPGTDPATSGASEAGSENDLITARKAAFAICVACHTVAPDAESGIGPNLNGVVGRKAATLENFNYSDALTASGITWDETELDAFLANPRGKVPGTTMSASAVSDEERRRAIIAYLTSLSE